MALHVKSERGHRASHLAGEGEFLRDFEPINLFDFEKLAESRVGRAAWDYYASGAGDEITLRDNHAAYDRIRLRYRVLRDVSQRDLSATVLDQRVSMPVLIAPTAFHGLACPDGELATARAAGAAGTIMMLSTLSNTALEDVAQAAAGPLWFQLYIYKDRGATADLVERAGAAGFGAIVLTVDAPVLGKRERDIRNRFALPPDLAVQNLAPAGMGAIPPSQGSGLAAYFASLLDASISWKDLEWLRSATRLPVLVKGIVRGDDAQRAVELGASAVIVSNHGGRQLDTAPPTINVLAEIVQAVDGRAEVLIDGGIRRGTDVVKALALGARAVLLGRPILWGLAVDGQAGVCRVLDLMRAELDSAMALCGCASLADITPDLVMR